MSSLIGWAQTLTDPWKGDAIMFRMSWLYIFRSAVHIGITSLTLQMILGDNPVLIWDQYLVITVPADGLAPNGARPSAGTVLTIKLNMFFLLKLWAKFKFAQ